MFDRLLLSFFLIGMSPLGPELVEWGAHFVRDGDFAHAAVAGHESNLPDEHGCSTTNHVCPCHAGVTAFPPAVLGIATATYPPTSRPQPLTSVVPPAISIEPGIRPPIA